MTTPTTETHQITYALLRRVFTEHGTRPQAVADALAGLFLRQANLPEVQALALALAEEMEAKAGRWLAVQQVCQHLRGLGLPK